MPTPPSSAPALPSGRPLGSGARPGRNTLERRLALAHIRELRRRGLSYLEIGRRFRAPEGEYGTNSAGTPSNRRRPPSHAAPLPAAALAGRPGDRIRVFDVTPGGVAVFDRSGALVYLNRELAQMLGAEGGAGELQAELLRFAASLRASAHDRGDATEELGECIVHTPHADYRLRACRIAIDFLDVRPALLIAVEQLASTPLCEETLRRRFGLTRAEARVAHLLAEGRSNAGIAAELCVSPHTVRHHTERVLAKLDVRSRAQVAHRLRGG
jgi:DNA-binding CsgD family transcriptional regulator